jgi:hypothetical protein
MYLVECTVEMFGGGYLSPVEEIFSSSNPEDAPKALTVAGWSPEPSDKNPTLTATLPKETSILKITADIRKATEVEVVNHKQFLLFLLYFDNNNTHAK